MDEPDRCFDAHSDILYSTVRERAVDRTGVIAEEFLSDMRANGITMRVAAVYLNADYVPEMAVRRALNIIMAFHHEIEETPGLEAATTAKDIRAGTESEPVTLILAMEGAEPLVTDLSLLDAYYRLGLRVLTLTHSRRNMLGDGALFSPQDSGTPGGLSPFGVDVLDRMEDLGMVIDVSHLNDTGFWDVIDRSHDPIIASHSNCRALKDHPRNLTDDQIQALAATDGVIGVNAINAYVADGTPTIDDVIDHIERIVDLAGIDHVGLGFDFYDYNLQYMSEAERDYMIDVSTADGLANDADVSNLAPALRDRGFTDEETAAILLENFTRVFETILGS